MNGKDHNPHGAKSFTKAMQEALQKCKDDEIFKVMVDDKTTKAFALQRVCEVIINHFEEKSTEDSEATIEKLSKLAQQNQQLNTAINDLKQKHALEVVDLQGKIKQSQTASRKPYLPKDCSKISSLKCKQTICSI